MVIIATTVVPAAYAQLADEPRPEENWLQQPYIDAQAQKGADTKGDFLKGPTEPWPERVKPINSKTHPWRPLTDARIRANSGYWAPKNYVYHKSARADMDRDGHPDLVELVENGKQGAIRITYAASGKRSRIVSCDNQVWSGQGLFAAGEAVMINYPESRLYFLFQDREHMRVRFVGD